VAVTQGEVQETPCVHILGKDGALRDAVDEFVDQSNCLEHGLPKHRRAETIDRLRTGIVAHALQRVQEERKRPLAVCTTDHAQVPLIGKALAQPPLDLFPAAQAAVVHPHQTAVAERVAVVLAQGALSSSSDVGEDEVRCRLGGQPLQVDAVPCGGRGCEEAGGGAELGFCVEADAEAVGIVLSAARVLCRAVRG